MSISRRIGRLPDHGRQGQNQRGQYKARQVHRAAKEKKRLELKARREATAVRRAELAYPQAEGMKLKRELALERRKRKSHRSSYGYVDQVLPVTP